MLEIAEGAAVNLMVLSAVFAAGFLLGCGAVRPYRAFSAPAQKGAGEKGKGMAALGGHKCGTGDAGRAGQAETAAGV